LGVVIPRHAGGTAREGRMEPAQLGKGAALPPPLHPPPAGVLTPLHPSERARTTTDDALLDASSASALSVVPTTRKPKRQRQHVLPLRADDTERAEMEARASASGLSLGAYLRACALGDAGPRARRRPPVEREQLGRANAEINRVGNNLNQIARALNEAALEDPGELAYQLRELDQSIVATLTELSVTLAAIRGALGYDRQR
jgi:hypothetical protein